MTPEERIDQAMRDVREARGDQINKWGEQRHDIPVWLTILAEEVGEVSQSALRLREAIVACDVHPHPSNYYSVKDQLLSIRYEAAQAAAVCVALIEHVREVSDNLLPYSEGFASLISEVMSSHGIEGAGGAILPSSSTGERVYRVPPERRSSRPVDLEPSIGDGG
jgi:hypothetical protein